MIEKPTYEDLEKKILELEKAESDRKRAENELQMSEEKFRVLFEKSIHGILIVDIETRRFPYANPAFCRLFGYSEAEIRQIGVDDIHPKESLDYILSEFNRQKKGKKAGATELPCVHKDGTIFNADIAATNIVVNHRKSVVGFFIDITERKQAEVVLQKAHDDLEQRVAERTKDLELANEKLQKDIVERKQMEKALQKSEERFRGIIESMADWTWEVDCEGRYTFCTKRVESILGYTPEEMIGKTPFDFMPPNEAEKIGKIFAKIIAEKGSINSLENLNLSKKGQEVYLITSGVPILNQNGELLGFRGVDKDITDLKTAEAEQKRLELKLQQAQKIESIGQLAGGIAHDFNNILYPIIGFTQMSMEELPKAHPVQENLQDILDGAKRASELIKQILSFSRQKKLVLKPTILTPVVNETMKLLRSTIPTNIDIQVELYNGEDNILCDATEIHEIVMNLCMNAYHAIEFKGGKIKVNLSKTKPDPKLNLPSGEYICLSVSDNGTGIPKNMIDKIFEPYYTTKKIGKGSGLGLSVVHGIVKNYKGEIEVISRLEKGTTFNIFLPITTKKLEIEQKQEKTRPLFGTEKILFVDDEMSIVKLGIRILERLGYKVTGVNDSSEALALFESSPKNFDLVITDMAMPGMEGTELAQKIYEIHPEIPIILCSGFSKKIDLDNANRFNIKAFIDKPILIDDLTTKVRELLDQSNGGRNA